MSQINVSSYATNATVIVYTVGGGRTFYLNAVLIEGINIAVAAAYCTLYITNSVDALQYTLKTLYLFQDTVRNVEISFPKPIIIPSGYKVKINSAAAGIHIYAFIHGFQI